VTLRAIDNHPTMPLRGEVETVISVNDLNEAPLFLDPATGKPLESGASFDLTISEFAPRLTALGGDTVSAID